MDVHKEAIVIAVLNGSGKLIMETIVETKASSILQFIHGLRGELQVTWDEGTWAAWLYDLLQPQVLQVLVCDPRRNDPQGSPQNRPTVVTSKPANESGLGLSCFTPPPPVEASLFSAPTPWTAF